MKRYLPWAVAALLAIILAAVLLLSPRKAVGPTVGSPSASKAVDASKLHAVIWKTTGEVSVERRGERSAAVQGQTIQSGDVIHVGQGEAELEFYSGARTVVAKQSDLTIIEASIDAASPQKQVVKLSVGAFGRVWSRVLKLLDKDSTYEMNVGSVGAVVRGTAFQTTRRAIASTDSFWFDQFDGTLNIYQPYGRGDRETALQSGFSLSADLKNLPKDLSANIMTTPDETLNDPWVQAQLSADGAFVKRAAEIRKQLGDQTDYSSFGSPAAVIDTQATILINTKPLK